jgi:hypothetical protein
MMQVRQQYYQKSLDYIGTKDYQLIFENLNDSIDNWKENNLGYYQYFGKSKSYQVDSLLCFNSDKTKFITAVLQQQLLPDGVQDDIWYFYGAKIKEQWFFFSGATIVLPREYYQDDIHSPLSFEKLHEIAMKEVFNGYLIKNKKGEWEVNEDFFSDLTSVAWCTDCHTQEEWDAAYMRQVYENWAKKE